MTTTLEVEVRLKFVLLLAARGGVVVTLANRTPMGFAALKVNPSAALKTRSAANCSPIRRTHERGTGVSEPDCETVVIFEGCVVAGALPRCGL